MKTTWRAVIPAEPDPARSGVAVAAIFLNEGRYLAEWIDFHRLAGVSHFYLYDNGSTDDSLEVIGRYPSELVTVIPWRSFYRMVNNQESAYAHALSNFGAPYRWMALIDIDEFLYPTEGGSLMAVLDDYDDLPTLYVPHLNYGFSGHWQPAEGLVTEQYVYRGDFPPRQPEDIMNVGGKSVVDPARVSAIGVHVCHFDGVHEGPEVIFNELRMRGSPSDPAMYASDRLRINHYFTRSRAEFEQKLQGAVCYPGRSEQEKQDLKRERLALAAKLEREALRDDGILRIWANGGTSMSDRPRQRSRASA
jgi:hypothetical protein